MNTARLPVLLVLASTYPRWEGDHEPGFVHELSKRLTGKFHVIALVPSAPRAARAEVLDGVEVIRFRYAPRPLETLVNDGGIVANLRHRRWKIVLVPAFVLAQTWYAWRITRTRRIDVIHAHWLLPQGLIVALLRNLSRCFPPYVVTSHGADLFALRGKISNALKRFVIRNAAATTVVSEAMRAELLRIGASVATVSIRPMGVDLSRRFTPDPAVQRSRDEILFVGRMVEKKGLRHLIDAMPAILKAHPSACLTVAGFGPEEDERRMQVDALGLQGHVTFLGPISQTELPDLYRRAAAFVAPFVQASSGDQEGLGLVAVEAAGCGCPVVLSDLPAVRCAFDSCLAHWVIPGSTIAISEAVADLLTETSSCDHLAQTRATLCARFDWRVVADGYAKLLRDKIDSRVKAK